jgi:hypothetical protein
MNEIRKVSNFLKLERITPTEYDIIETVKGGKEKNRIRITWNEMEALYENYLIFKND